MPVRYVWYVFYPGYSVKCYYNPEGCQFYLHWCATHEDCFFNLNHVATSPHHLGAVNNVRYLLSFCLREKRWSLSQVVEQLCSDATAGTPCNNCALSSFNISSSTLSALIICSTNIYLNIFVPEVVSFQTMCDLCRFQRIYILNNYKFKNLIIVQMYLHKTFINNEKILFLQIIFQQAWN